MPSLSRPTFQADRDTVNIRWFKCGEKRGPLDGVHALKLLAILAIFEMPNPPQKVFFFLFFSFFFLFFFFFFLFLLSFSSFFLFLNLYSHFLPPILPKNQVLYLDSDMFLPFKTEYKPFLAIEKNFDDPSVFMVGNIGGNEHKTRLKLMNAGYIGMLLLFDYFSFFIFIGVSVLISFLFRSKKS